ncbi:RIO1 family regulatory kinase/ATPase [Acetobacterium malicum]|uniref:RIO1 family regulatory kinase/ATPase domain-containing protein n=1 Tax=Acetobacterium malicum TaxID=52692 RepID=UPI0004798893|nr:RIO1 family regulatory kinase/ATPase [Acetobacterium dehalogenans]
MMSETIQKYYQTGNYQVLRQFKSKKNRVQLIEISAGQQVIRLIEKTFTEAVALKKELSMLNLLHEMAFSVPECLGQFDRVLLYEYLGGMTLCEKLEIAEVCEPDLFSGPVNRDNEITELFKKTIDWLDQLHQKTGLTFYDINLRNFIVRDNLVYAIDYEDFSKLKPVVDYGRLLAFILTYKPVFTEWKKALIRELEDYLNNEIKVNMDEVRQEKERELARINERRAKLV